MFPAPIERAPRPLRVAYPVLVVGSLVLWLVPLAAVLLTSVRSLEDVNLGNYWGWPRRWLLLENYSAVFSTTPMGAYLLNSLLITVPSVLGAVGLSSLAGFGLARYAFRGNVALLALFTAGNLVPFQILMIPVRQLTLALGLYDTITGLVAFHVAFQTGFCTLFMRNFIRTLPEALLESARIDGASEWQIFYKIVLPLMRPALAALSVLVFTFVWNDYFWALVLVQSEAAQPVTAGLQSLKGMWVASWQLISAGAVLAALLPASLFFFMQRHFIAGLTLGATKG
jgi:multiple sugar transport system permease protein